MSDMFIKHSVIMNCLLWSQYLHAHWMMIKPQHPMGLVEPNVNIKQINICVFSSYEYMQQLLCVDC